ncbi:peptide chain release factor 1, mitochondrial [Tachyglossus aculeatus]|uniref:peptide chain release factor 1, mitochondrial n=1 Tax=Tachyglossus aculeatus TaxID=9261 RepID=UPI0018F5F4F5|nr:peptide chain release factor 1, mitochondrial [Tachyglossus aculeatus]
MNGHLGVRTFKSLSAHCCHQRPSWFPLPHLIGLDHGTKGSICRPKWNPICSGLSLAGLRRCYHRDARVLWKHKALQKYMENLCEEHQSLGQLLERVSVSEADRKTLSKRQAQLSPLAAIYQEIREAERAAEELESMCQSLDGRDEKQLLELAVGEKRATEQKINSLCRELFQGLVPKEKDDKNDIILEVISGRTTGGDICQQFTKEMFEMYQKYAYYKHWTFEILNYTPADYGGLHHAAARVSGDRVYRHLKYEGGIHRVQRIPEVGLSSRMQRIHTGTMSVIILPQPDEVDVKVDPKDLRIDTFRAKGAGGQHVNTTDSAVRIVHTPTGLVVECQQERSQLRNKDTAMRVLRAKLYQKTLEREQSQKLSARKLQVGTRAQSERIRTYNFTQDRVTDHRISYDIRNIKEFLGGERPLDMLIHNLLLSANEEAVVELLDNFKSSQESS